jgi:hypothetical protein
LKARNRRFAPPTPETSPTTTPAQTAGAIVAGFGIIAADIALGGLISSVSAIPSFASDKPSQPDITPLLATIADTRAPIGDGRGNVNCTGCADLVPYATMSLDEHGYFCVNCTDRLTNEAGD